MELKHHENTMKQNICKADSEMYHVLNGKFEAEL